MIDRGSSGKDGSSYGPDAVAALATDEARWADATCVALLRSAEAGPATLEAVQRLARGLREHRPVFLLNLEGPGSGLDDRLASAGRPGLAAVRRGERKVGEATLRPSGERFLYLPAGTPDAEPSGRPAGDPAVAVLVQRLREKMEDAGWLLLVLMAPEETAELGVALDGHVLLEPGLEVGPSAGPAIGRPGGEPGAGTRPGEGSERGEAREGRDARGGPAAGEPSPAPEEAEGEERPPEHADTGEEAGGEPAQWRRHRRRDGPPVGKVAVAVFLLAALAGGWWWFAGRAGEAAAGAAGGGSDRRSDAASGTIAAASTADTSARAAGTDVPAVDTTARGSGADVALEASELGYSVQVASYGNAQLALGRIASWSDGGLYFAAPARVGGTTYWRVYAGAFAVPSAAEALNRHLAASGRKDSARAWDVRPVPLAFLVGTFGAREDAERRAAALRRDEMPAYVLAAVADGDTTWQVYAGAYESEEEAAALRSRLAEAGVEAELVTRRGEPTGR